MEWCFSIWQQSLTRRARRKLHVCGRSWTDVCSQSCALRCEQEQPCKLALLQGACSIIAGSACCISWHCRPCVTCPDALGHSITHHIISLQAASSIDSAHVSLHCPRAMTLRAPAAQVKGRTQQQGPEVSAEPQQLAAPALWLPGAPAGCKSWSGWCCSRGAWARHTGQHLAGGD